MSSSSASPPKSGLGKLCRTPLLSPNKSVKRERPLSLSLSTGAKPSREYKYCVEMERVFHYLDENGDGKISPSELRSCMNKTGVEVSEEELMALVESTDSDGDGLLGYQDFVRLMESSDDDDEENSKDLREAFGMYESKDGSGCITPKSLCKMLRRLGDSNTTIHQCTAMIRHFDLDGNGVLSFEEFRVMMM